MTADSRTHFDLAPADDWANFARNKELADHIYEIGLNHVNEGDWHYINPMTGIGIFEDAEGDYLCVETEDRGAENVIVAMHFGVHEPPTGQLAGFVEQVTRAYGLRVTPKDQT